MKRLLALVTSSVAAALLAPAAQADFIYATNAFNDRVDRYDAATGAGQGSFGDGLLNDPFGITVAPDGRVVVADTGNNEIDFFTPAGELIQTIPGGLFVAPTDLVVGPDGKLHVTFGGSDDVVTYTPSGDFLSSFSTGPESGPRSVTFGTDGNVYVSLVGDGGGFGRPPGADDRIAVFNSAGMLVRNIGTGGTGPDQFNNPVGVVFDPAGDVLVLDHGNNAVKTFTTAGTFRRQFGSFGFDDGQFFFPLGFTGTQNELVVADSFNDRIQVFDLNGLFQRKWPSNFPTDVAVGAATAPPGSVLITGTKFEDVNGNGSQDAGEGGLPGWTIYVDRDRNGVLSGGDPTVITGVEGRFEFTPAPPGEFQVREVAQAGWTQSTESIDLTLDAGATADVKIGNFKHAKVTGTVFEDGNRDGVRDAGENGLQGWTVFWDENGDGVRQDNEPLVGTGPGGGYALEFGPGSGTMTVERQPGWTPTTSPGPIVATSGLETTQDLGVARLLNGRIIGVKFDDLNGNEQRDPGEPRLGGWTIYLDLNENGVLDAGEPVETTNDVDPALRGDVAFNGLRPGVYVVREVPQPGWAPMPPQVVTVSDGSTAEIDLPNARHGRVDGMVFEDQDADGQRDPGERGLTDWKAFLDLNRNGILNALEPSATTGPGGVYHLGELPRSNGVMRVEPKDGFELTTPPDSGTTITSGVQLTRDFGVRGTGGIIGDKFEDLNGDGRREEGEPLLDDVRLFLDENGNDVLDAGEAEVTTKLGSFAFDGLAPGDYRLVEVRTPGYQRLEPRLITVSPGAVTFVELPNRKFGTAQGFLYDDRDRNNARGAGEPALVGWTVFVDQDDDRTLDPSEQHTTTGNDGGYRFVDLGSGPAALAVQTQPGWQTTDVDYYRFTVTSGTAVTRDFGFSRTVEGSIDVFAFTDVAGDAIQDAGDAGLGGTLVFLDLNNNGVLNDGEPNGLTGDGGNVAFGGLAAGTYYVRVSAFPSADYVLTTQNPPAIEIEPDNQTASVQFGAFQLGQASGAVFDDRNGNNARDAGEPGLGNWSVLLDRNDDGTFDAGEQMTATSSDGAYSFTGVGPGAAAVVVQTQSGWEGVDIFRFTPTSGGVLTHDFGFVQPPLAISGLTATALGPHDVRVTFTTNRDATGDVRFRTRSWPEGTPPATSHVVVLSGLEPQTPYVMDVVAEGADGQTATASATAETAAPGGFTPSLVVDPVTGIVGVTFPANPATLTTQLTGSQRFVAQAYRDLLGREIDPAGVGFWAGVLAGGTRADVALGLQQTDELRGAIVAGMYQTFLGRAGTPSEVASGASSLQTVSRQAFAAQILGSAEYFTRAGDENAAWVTRLYQDVLDRTPTTGEAGSVLGALSAGQSREAAAVAVLTSREALTNVVRDMYLRYLHREAGPGDVDFFVNRLSDERLAAALIGSSEYFAAVPASFEIVARAGTATIETGDGRTVAGALDRTGANTFRVTGDLNYDAPGLYDLGLTVFDGANVVTGATTAEIRPDLGASLIQDATDPTKTELRVLGTSAGDTIALDRPGGGAIRVVLNGVPAGLFSPTGRIVVDALGGGDTVNISSTISRRSWVYGGSGDDVVDAASSGGNLLLGGDGNDRITGGAGRDLLIGGTGADVLGGSGGDDILVGGLTTLDGDTAALAAVMAEWSSTRSYAVKVDNLTRFLGPGTTAPNDGEADELRGARARDWFLAALNDFTDAGSGETVTLIP